MNPFHKKTIDEVKTFIQTNPHACAMKDKNSVFLYTNAHYARLVGFKHAEDFVGRTDFDVPSGQANCAPLFRAQDQEVIHKPHIMKSLDVHPEARGKWHALVTTKTVFFNTDGEVGGTFFQMKDITSEATLRFCCSLGKSIPYGGESHFANQCSYIFGTPNTLALTERQEKILFFLIRRYSVKKIALALEVPPKTVYKEVDILKTTFKALSVGELIEKAITQGCIAFIPRGLLCHQQSIILHDD